MTDPIALFLSKKVIMRHPKSGKEILNKPICCDDFGSMVFKCQYTDAYVLVEDAIFLGPVMPNVSGTYVCSKNSLDAYKASRSLFNETDANCNFCNNLVRIKHEKSKAGFLFGTCQKGIKEQIYPIKDNVIMFHPDDCLNFSCWESRKTIQSI